MGLTDWFIAIFLNGAIIVCGLISSRDTKTSADWVLAGRNLPWRIIALSLYATAIDSSDIAADAVGTYTLGLMHHHHGVRPAMVQAVATCLSYLWFVFRDAAWPWHTICHPGHWCSTISVGLS